MDMKNRGRNIVSDIITTVLFIAMLAVTIMAYFWGFGLEGDFVKEFKFLSAAFLISAASYFVYWAYRSLSLSNKAARIILTTVFFLLYFAISAVSLYFGFLLISDLLCTLINDLLPYNVFPYFLWACHILMVIAYPLSYFLFWDRTVIKSFIMLIILVLSLLLIFIIIYLLSQLFLKLSEGFGAVLRAILPETCVDSSRQKYEFTNSMGCTETVYSSDGKDFYSSSGELRGISNDGGKTITPR